MYETLSLFEQPELEFRKRLAAHLRKLAERDLYLGTSSWKYEGWLGQVYSPERYYAQGRFSRKRFEQECLLEYAETFRIVSGDFAFYQFPTSEFWRRLFGQVAPPFQFAFKVPEDITLSIFPSHVRYRQRAGRPNRAFLDAELLRTQFLDLLRPYSDRVALLILEFAASVGTAFSRPQDFAEAIAIFFSVLPKDFRYAVELRQRRFLDYSYFHALRDNGVAHVFNSWTDIPGIEEQAGHPDAFTADFTAARALLRPGRTYDESVRMFSPYQEIREPNAEVRAALRQLLIRSRNRAEPSYIFVNNRLEGFAPGTIAAVAEGL